jgi:RNA polymerase sigma factor (sigma-70 family)
MISDRELLAQFVATQSEHAMTEIVQRHSALVYRTSLRILHRQDLAEDAAQATFVVLLQHANRIGSRLSLAGWLHHTAFRCAQNMQRMRIRRCAHESFACPQRSDNSHLNKTEDMRLHLDEALIKLPDVQRSAIILRYFEDLAPADAARRLGCTEATLQTRLHRGVSRLRAMLGRRESCLSALLLLLEKLNVEGSPLELAGGIQRLCRTPSAITETVKNIAQEAAPTIGAPTIPSVMAGAAALIVAVCMSLSLLGSHQPQSNAAQTADSRTASMVAASPAILASSPTQNKAAASASALAVDNGMAWLAAVQEVDGRYDSERFGGAANQDVAVTSLVALAFLGAGHTSKVGAYKGAVKKSVEWLSAQHPKAITSVALRAWALAEHTGMSRRNVAEAQAAIDELIASQQPSGEWIDESVPNGYGRMFEPTSWAQGAILSARIAGLRLPFDARQRLIDGFEVQQREVNANAGNSTGARMAAVLALEREFNGFAKSDPQVHKNLSMAGSQRPAFPNEGIGHDGIHWMWGSLACFQQGGSCWREWRKAMDAALLPSQIQTGALKGSWDARSGCDPFIWGRLGATAVATQALETTCRYEQLCPEGHVDLSDDEALPAESVPYLDDSF